MNARATTQSGRRPFLEAGATDFSPLLLRIVESPPNPLGRSVLWLLLALVVALCGWASVGELDIVAVAEGKLVPHGYVKIVQPAESGVVQEILVKEGDAVHAGQVLIKMDALYADADARSLQAEFLRRRATLARIDAELEDRPYAPDASDPPELAREIAARHRANRSAFEAALAEETARLRRSRHDVASAVQIHAKLGASLAHYVVQDQAFEQLARDGFVGVLMASDKKRERVEREQELTAQGHQVEAARSAAEQSERRLAQLDSDYRRQLHAERADAQGQAERLAQDLAKLAHRRTLLELRAGQDSIVKDLATHSVGTVVQPGTVLLTLVPRHDPLRAEVWVGNDDVGFVRPGQAVRLKLAAFPFQKYGMLDGSVEHVGADSTESPPAGGTANLERGSRSAPLAYRALVALHAMELTQGGERLSLTAGMQTNAEILIGRRTVLEYLLSPIQRASHEAGRER